MKLSFESHSLLHGISYMWLIIQIFTPYFIWPNFARTRSDHVLGSAPRLLSIMDSVGKQTRAIYWAPRLIMYVMVSLNVAILCITDYLQAFFLMTIGVTDDTKLSFKVLRTFPICAVSI